MATLQQILAPITLTKVISRQMAAEKWVLPFMQMQPGGKNELFLGHGREGSYQVFNSTRQVATMRAPGTAAGRASRQAVGVVPIVYPRMHEQIDIPAELTHNLAKIGDPRARDIAGAEMIKRQTKFAAQKAANWRVAQIFGMLRDELYVHSTGDDWYLSFTSASSLFQLNTQMPAANKTQLEMGTGASIIDISWDNPQAPIPGHLSSIDAAFQSLYGGRLRNIMCQSDIWQNIINNDFVASQAGIANPPFTENEKVVGTKEDGTPLSVAIGKIGAAPNVTFWVTDEGLDLGAPGSETFTKYVGDNQALFLGDPSDGMYSLQLGSEPIAEYDGGPETVRIGLSAWSKKSSNPTATEIFNLDNALAINHIPNSGCNGTVVF